MARPSSPSLPPDAAASFRPLCVAQREYERQYILRALKLTKGKTQAAELLGISRKNLWEKMKLHGITDADFAGD
jgi:DNA-binding NtrC family response regulator